MSTHTEFERELFRLYYEDQDDHNAWLNGSGEWDEAVFIKSIMQAIDKYVIGDNLHIPGSVTSDLREVRITQNHLKDIQRQSLWGTKK